MADPHIHYFLCCLDCSEYVVLGTGPNRKDYQAAEDIEFYDDLGKILPTFMCKHTMHELSFLNQHDYYETEAEGGWINYLEAKNADNNNPT